MHIRKILQTNSYHIVYNYISTYLIRLSTIWFKMMNHRVNLNVNLVPGTLDFGSMNSKSINKLGIAN